MLKLEFWDIFHFLNRIREGYMSDLAAGAEMTTEETSALHRWTNNSHQKTSIWTDLRGVIFPVPWNPVSSSI